MRRKIGFSFCMVLLPVLLMGCTNYHGKLDEGNISCKIALENIPDVLLQLEEQSVEDINIQVTVNNPVTRKYYEFELNEENDFTQEATLNPGTYEMPTYFYVTPSYYAIEVSTNQEALEVGPDKANYVSVYIKNEDGLAQQLQDRNASKEIIAADYFSRKVQWHGQIIDMTQIKDYIHFDYEDMIGAYQEAYIGNAQEKVSLVVLNETGQPACWQDCTLKGVEFFGSSVVLAGGVTIGMPYKAVLHSQTGAYGTPEAMTGSILLGTGMEALNAYYNDPVSGDKITVMSDVDGEYVKNVRYDFAVFE